jgi:glutathione S-transferase
MKSHKSSEVVVDLETYNNSVKEVKEFVKIINQQLDGKKYLLGSKITLADIAIAT